MNRALSLILSVLGTTCLPAGSAHALVPYAPAPQAVTCGEEGEQPHDELSAAEELAMWNTIRHNIATLREQFMEFCDHLNLDAILEPVKG